MIIKQFFILMSALFLGYLVSDGLGLPIPANVTALLLLFAALCFKLVKVSDIEKASNFIIEYLAFFFVPAAVGIMTCFSVFSANFLKIMVPLFVAILAGFFVAGHVTQLLIRVTRGHRHERVQ